MELVFLTLSLSLLDSLSTTMQIIVFVLLLTTANPHRNAASYLAGLSGAYFLCGVGGFLAFDELRPLLEKMFGTKAIPDQDYYLSELLTGLVLVGLGVFFYYRGQKSKKSRLENWLLPRLGNMKGWFAFGLGAFISVTSFPAAPPYLVALGKYDALPGGFPESLGFILLYNLGYALPMALIWFAYVFFRKETKESRFSFHEKAARLNVLLTTWAFVGFGIFSMVDAGFFFFLGHSLLKGRYF